MQAGDIICVAGHGWQARAIRFGQSRRPSTRPVARITHVALAVSETDIVEARWGHVRRRPFPAPDEDPHTVCSLPVSTEDRAEMVAYALSVVGQEYGVLAIACIALALVTSGKIVFAENRHLTCSQLVGNALLRAGVIWDRDTPELMPADIARYCQSTGGSHDLSHP